MEIIIEKILTKLNKKATDIAIKKHGNRHPNTWYELLRALLIGGNIKEASKLLSQTNDSLEQYMRRYISPIFKEVSYKGKWSNTLLRFINYKECTKCSVIKPASEFGKDISKFDGLRGFCRECSNSYKKEYAILNQEKIIRYRLISYNRNSYYYKFKSAKRRAALLQATPNWANLIAIKEIYRTCQEGYHVDHIVPLQCKFVCGLHCEFNLQHLPAKDNLSKGNKFEI